MTDVLKSLKNFALDIKIAHSVFALPFAVSALVIGNVGLPSVKQNILLLVCMISARSFAMGMNRFLDRHIDAVNPRTQNRQIPTGNLTPKEGLTWSLVWGGVFILSAFFLNNLSGFLSFPVLAILAGYSFMKKISWLTHWYLGFCLGLAPIAVSIALLGYASLPVLFLGAAVTMWTAGFDILYSIQDIDFDQGEKLHSAPSRFGIKRSVMLSRFSFVAMIIFLLAAGYAVTAGVFYFAAVILIASILAYEHWLVRDLMTIGKTDKMGAAFFTMNAWVSFVFYVFVQIDYLLK